MASQPLQRWAQALGGLERLRQIEAIYIRFRVEMGGLAGTLEMWSTTQGQHREALDLAGVYKNLTVVDRDRGWVLDQNGKVQELAGLELATEITSTYIDSFSHLVPGRMAGQVEHVGEDESGTLVRFLPEGGRPVTYHLDAQTGLPTRQERPQAERTFTTSFDDWREVNLPTASGGASGGQTLLRQQHSVTVPRGDSQEKADTAAVISRATLVRPSPPAASSEAPRLFPVEGIRFPWHARQTSGDPKYDVVLDVEEVQLNVPVDEAMFQRPAEAPPDFFFATGHSARGIPIELASNHIYLQLRVNDSEPLWFLLDTGAGGSCIDNDQARAQGLELQGKLEGRGAGEGSTDVAFVTGATFHLPGVQVVDQTIAAISLTPLTPFEGRPIHGILGYDFISRFVVEIDYGTGQLHLHDPRHYTYAGAGESLTIFLEDNVPFIRAELVSPGRETLVGQFLLDTGARVALILTRPFVEGHELVPEKTITAPFGIGVGGETKQYIGRMPRVQLGTIALLDVVAGFSQDVKGAGANPDRAGLIGGEVLRRFTTIFDYAGGRMILEPNARFGETYEYDMSGLFLAAEGSAFDSFRVHRVVADSPAAEAGLQEGDVLLALDGRPSREFTLEQIRQMLKEAGRQLRLTLQRDQETWDVALTLRRLI
jgi:hypothetical protein